MEHRLRQRTNSEWVAALRSSGERDPAALEELQGYLHRVLARLLGRSRPAADELADFVQETMLQIVTHLESFRGDSAFTTWATAVATRTAFTELRRRRVRDTVQLDFDVVREEAEALASPGRGVAVDAVASGDELLQALEEAIRTQLTTRQRTAILAELRGLPTVEIAERMGTNQNALYKLTHDARKKLRTALVAAGFTVESLHDAAEGIGA